ncbi:MAG: hypothetical protein CR986_08885 [Ignavibacteriae bacterium]|nr:MAG: hypothetical protein CR986_08885 [Ignavibacteriota bacterium]
MKSKDRIIFEAFKLFCLKPYNQVTFADIEKATNLSRGAILYHFKTKENIFYSVINKYVLNRNSIAFIEKTKRENLQTFILAFIELLKRNKRQMKKWGIKNMNMALLNIESSAYAFYPQMQEKAVVWHDKQLQVWQEVIANAANNNEIRNDIDLKVFAGLFEKIYLGLSFLSISRLQGVEIEELQKDFDNLYRLLKI